MENSHEVKCIHTCRSFDNTCNNRYCCSINNPDTGTEFPAGSMEHFFRSFSQKT